MGTLKQFVTELRRRRVFRMTAIYIVAAWIAVQVASEAFPALNIPAGAIRYVWAAALIGFPVAVLFSWKYDFTAYGIRRTPKAQEDGAARQPLTRVDHGILAALVVVILATFLGTGQRLIEIQTETGQAPTTRVIDPNSIAVLPLESLSPNSDDVYFRAGDRTRELDPLSTFMVAWLADQYRDACQYEKALSLAREAVRLDPEHPVGWMTMGLTYAELGEFDEAIDAHGHLAEKPSWSWVARTSYAAAGLEDKAREFAAALQEYPGTALPLAALYSQMGDRESALHWISEVEKARMPWYPWLLGWWPGIESIVADPQVKARAEALGLPDPETMSCRN